MHAGGATVLTADGSDHARLWEAATGAPVSPPINHLMVPLHGSADRLQLAPAFSRDGRLMVAAQGQVVSLWDIREHALNQRAIDFTINRVELDAEGVRLLVAGKSSIA